ncbi:MAG: carboxypeptidase regulatory-like domain-containing protein [Acidobacteria bacterium]|nr:carboxypeptidase regulatory-like domain-containing protein [Acidobacteriota bacterium]
MKSPTVFSIVLLLVASLGPPGAAQSDTRLEGLVMGFDGRPAAGFRVHLIDDSGSDRAQADVDAAGSYTLAGVQPGRYVLALEMPDGRFAAVDAPPLRIRAGHLVRRDLKLIERDPADPAGLAQRAYGFGTWWAGLETRSKVWTVVAIVVIAGITAEALSSDEALASQFAN